jgi:curli production assembly/transport component CsgE
MTPKNPGAHRRRALAFLVWLACTGMLLAEPTPSRAQDSVQDPGQPAQTHSASLDSGKLNRDPLRGIVINRTMTVLGWDFYTSFSTIWQSLHPDSEFTLSITERPTAKYGSEIWVSYRDQQVFHTFMSPARARINDVAKQAVEMVHENLKRIQEQRQLYTDGDLAPEEF